MERRGFDAPMDFEYDNKRGHIPADSPWLSGNKPLQHFGGRGLSKNNMSFDANSRHSAFDQNFDSPS
ncbi:MAG: hypothetical protein LQ340_005285, partial [Diploschistes diacapsis]